MHLKLLKSKLHLAAVTGSDLNYHGSLTIDADLMEAVGIHAYESILVSNVATGQRAWGRVEVTGAMARIGAVVDRLIVMAFALLEPEELAGHKPRVVALDE